MELTWERCSLELPVRWTAWTVVNCEQFQTVT